MTIIRPGEVVSLGEHLNGTVNEVIIKSNNHVSYLVSWWDGNTRNNEWLAEHEVQLCPETQTEKIGFKPGG